MKKICAPITEKVTAESMQCQINSEIQLDLIEPPVMPSHLEFMQTAEPDVCCVCVCGYMVVWGLSNMFVTRNIHAPLTCTFRYDVRLKEAGQIGVKKGFGNGALLVLSSSSSTVVAIVPTSSSSSHSVQEESKLVHLMVCSLLHQLVLTLEVH